MDLVFILLITATLVNSAFGVLLFFGEKIHTFSKIYALNVLLVVIWSILMIFFRFSDQENILLIAKLLYISGTFIASTFLYFCFLFLDIKKQIDFGKKIIIFLPSITIIVVTLFTDYIITDAKVVEVGENKIYFGTLYPIFIIAIVTYFFSGFTILLKKYFLFKNDIYKKGQILYLLSSYAFATNIALVSNLIFPWLGIFKYQWLGQVTTMVMVAFATMAIFKYKLFNIRLIATEILVTVLWYFLFIRIIISDISEGLVINIFLFLISVILGLLILKSVRKEVKQREEIEKLVESLKIANSNLKKLDKMKSEFVSIASHQLRSPLTSIRGYASMLLEGSYGKLPKKANEIVQRIAEASGYMFTSIDDYLNMSRIQAGNMKYDMVDFNLKAEVEQVVDDIRAQAMKKGLTVFFRSDVHGRGIINADKGKIRQILHNLCHNAIKYTNKGIITVLVYDSFMDKKIHVEIRDTGIGMDKQTISTLFGKFTRALTGHNNDVSGTGLGLYIAREMARKMEGEISAHSEGPGKGSVFKITLPMKM